MVTEGFSVANFHVMLALLKGEKFNTMCYADVILLRVLNSGFKAAGRQLIVQTDSAQPHTNQMAENFFEENQLQHGRHPPYSPDLAPWDFYLFGHIKPELMECRFSLEEDLFQVIQKILDEITANSLVGVFAELEGKLKWTIENNGEH
jgi:hypothetical protein